MENELIGIVGAGICGLTAARLLRQLGRQVVIFDKGRAPGGRVATRVSRAGHSFDHGAQHIGAEDGMFQGVLNGAMSTEALRRWDPAPGLVRYVGHPDMVSFPRHLARALDLYLETEVRSISLRPKGWRLTLDDSEVDVDRLVLTCPPAQTARLLAGHPLGEAAASIEMLPCLTIMAAFADGPVAPFASRRTPMNMLEWIVHEGSKPGRAPGARFVGHAGEAFSQVNLEAEKPEIAAMLLPILSAAAEREPSEAVYVAGHRWRYAKVDEPLGQPCLADDAGSLFVGGDWCLGDTVEAAWQSGSAIAEAIFAAQSA